MNQDTWNDIIENGAYSEELDWFAYDIKGNLGVFTAVMDVPIPKSIGQSFENYIQLNLIIESLPKITSSILVTSEQANFSNWILYSEKGLFAFDFHDVHRKIRKNQYDLITRPLIPIKLQSLNISSDLIFSMFKFEGDFSDGSLSTKEIF